MIETIKQLLSKPKVQEMAVRELADAQLSLLEAHTALEFATAMVKYNEERVKRLQRYIATGKTNPVNT
jgi:hypothetical protein